MGEGEHGAVRQGSGTVRMVRAEHPGKKRSPQGAGAAGCCYDRGVDKKWKKRTDGGGVTEEGNKYIKKEQRVCSCAFYCATGGNLRERLPFSTP